MRRTTWVTFLTRYTTVAKPKASSSTTVPAVQESWLEGFWKTNPVDLDNSAMAVLATSRPSAWIKPLDLPVK